MKSNVLQYRVKTTTITVVIRSLHCSYNLTFKYKVYTDRQTVLHAKAPYPITNTNIPSSKAFNPPPPVKFCYTVVVKDSYQV